MEITYVIIYQSMLFGITITLGDALQVPPGASMMTQSDWDLACSAAGSEENLKSSLGIVADYR